MLLNHRMTLGNQLDECILTLHCRKPFTAVPALTGIDLVILPVLTNCKYLNRS